MGMASEWRHCTVGELCVAGIADLQTGPFGTQLHAHDYVETGIPVVPTEAIRNRQIDHAVLPKISSRKAGELSRHRLEHGDILFARRGVQATGHIGYVREAERGFICGTGAIRLRVRGNDGTVSADFLSHVLANPASVEWFKVHAIGATMPNLNEGIIRSFPLKLPPLPEQRAIASILGGLDDKIELNRRMNQTLEEMAQAIFKSWFVDFDGHDDLVDSALGPIPRGWEVGPAAGMITLLSGGTPRTSVAEYWDGTIPWFSVKDAPPAGEVWVVDTEKKVTEVGVQNSATQILPERTTIISARGTVGKLALTGMPMAMNQSCYGVQGDGGYPEYYTYYLLQFLVEELQRRTHGSVFDTITRRTFETVSVVKPPVPKAQEFHDVVSPLLGKILATKRQSLVLAELRNALLPKLISGELRVRGAETKVERTA